MRVLWISCLLIGTITCGPVYKGYGSYNAVPRATRLMPRQSFSSAKGNYESDSGKTGLKDTGYGSPESSVHERVPYAEYDAPASVYAVADPGAEVGGGNVGSPSGYVDSSDLSVAEGNYGGSQEDGAFGYGVSGGTSEEIVEPVFSDVSDLEPVRSFSSRSRYQRGRRIFTRTRYTPGDIQLKPVSSPLHRQPASEPREPVPREPVPREPVPAPAKGGYLW